MTRALQPPRENAVQRAHSKTAATAKKSKPSAVWRWFDRWRSATKRAVARATTKPQPKKAAKKKSPAKQKTKREKRRRQAGALLFEVQPLYLVRGEDGPFRGAPDPTMVVCAWTLGDGGPQTVLRSVVRFDVRVKRPAAANPDVDRLMSTALDRDAPVLLFVALFEENRGDDVRRLAAALEHPERLHFVELSEGAPRVASAREAFDDVGLGAIAVRGVILDDSGDASRTTNDTWVGGAAVVVQHGARVDHRINLRTTDGTQDWIVAVTTTRT